MNMSAFEMTRMTSGNGGMDMMMPAVWDIGYAGLMFVMWWVMMIAMMLPSAAPTVLLFAALNRKRKEEGNPFVPTSLFASAYRRHGRASVSSLLPCNGAWRVQRCYPPC
jgi:predicted metal-binding membrane protein